MTIRMITQYTLLTCIVTSASAFYKEPITTREKKIFKIRMAHQAGSGYEWAFMPDKASKQYIALLKTDFESDNPERLSTSGKRIFTFRALKPGRIKIRFAKKQSWGTKEIDNTVIKIRIKRGR